MCKQDDDGHKAQEQVGHGNHVWLVTGQLHGQGGWGFEKTDLVKDVPIHGSGVGLRVSLKVSSSPNHPMIPIVTAIFSQIFFRPFVHFSQGFQYERHACASEWNNLDEMFKLELF